MHSHRPLHRGNASVPQSGTSSRVVRAEELQNLFRAVKGTFHDLVSSSCTSGKNGTRGGREHPPRNHSSSLEGSERGGGFHMSPTFLAAWESMAVITTTEGGNAAGLSSQERERSHPPVQRSTSARQRGHRRKRVVHSVQQRAKHAPSASPLVAECLRGEELHLGKPSP